VKVWTIANRFFDWLADLGVGLQMNGLFLAGVFAPPVTVLVLMETCSPEEVRSMLVLYMAAWILLFMPVSRAFMHVVALRNIDLCNSFCRSLQEGRGIEDLQLPPERGAENDFIRLKRNMYWMGRSLIDREERITAMLHELEHTQRQVLDSIEYASSIQGKVQTPPSAITAYVREGFVLWLPRDVVGGDSYWFKATPNGYFVGVFDCTGHGVPGAFITFIVHSMLDALDVLSMETHPGQVLGALNRSLKTFLGQDGETSFSSRRKRSNDGLEMGLCFYHRPSDRLSFAGAGIDLVVREGGQAETCKAIKAGIGYLETPMDFDYPEHELPAAGRFYMATDGLFDQTGGEKGLPFGKKRFLSWLAAQDGAPFSAQRDSLSWLLEEYRGTHVRRDDVTVLGFIP
jgi:serine phosphatase RsbU (regulator of sigma subunit)